MTGTTYEHLIRPVRVKLRIQPDDHNGQRIIENAKKTAKRVALWPEWKRKSNESKNIVSHNHRETQSTISQWADATFGEVKSLASIVARANAEMAELISCVTNTPDDSKALEEAVDVVICLMRAGELLNVDLLSNAREMLSKMWVQLIPNERWVWEANLDMGFVIRNSDPTSLTSDLVSSIACLMAFTKSRGFSLEYLIDSKMSINRRRQWRRDGNGNGYHLTPAQSAALGTWEDQEQRQISSEWSDGPEHEATDDDPPPCMCDKAECSSSSCRGECGCPGCKMNDW